LAVSDSLSRLHKDLEKLVIASYLIMAFQRFAMPIAVGNQKYLLSIPECAALS
jgi:hypothetical protein